MRSAAIPIVRPDDDRDRDREGGAGTPTPNKQRSTQGTRRICRNVLVYDSCKYQDQGCAYYHPPPGTDLSTLPTTLPISPRASPGPTMPKSTLNASAAVYPVPDAVIKERSAATGTPTPGATKSVGVEHLAAPVFVPKTPIVETSPQSNRPALSGVSGLSTLPSGPSGADWANASPFRPPSTSTVTTDSSMGLMAAAMPFDEGINFEPAHAHVGDAMFMAQSQRRPLDQHLYTSPLPHVANRQPMHSFFIPDDLRRMIHARQEATYANPGISAGLPSEVHVYHSLVPLGNPNPNVSRVYHHPGPVYRANSTVDGNVYCLRRIEGFKLSSEAAFAAVETWRQIRHANIVGLREAFTTKAFNDNSLVMVYDFHPNAITVADEWLNPEIVTRRRQAGVPIPERIIWSYVIQLANALKAVHTAGLAVRSLDATKILITGKNRIRINGVGILDVLAFDQQTPMALFQQEDLLNLGQLILSLCCDFLQPGQHYGQGLEYIGLAYSHDLKALAAYLLGKPTSMKSIDEVLRLAGPRILNELDAIQTYNDSLEDALGAEVENGRIVRLLTKLGFINERPEFEMDPQWSESGDRYVLKLFRDYVFHQVGPDGKPVLDMSHVLTTLNKLDAGARSREKVMLVSRDSQSCLVVEYRDIYKCIELAYSELRNAGKQPPPMAVRRP